jgi:hypothetical protein
MDFFQIQKKRNMNEREDTIIEDTNILEIAGI